MKRIVFSAAVFLIFSWTEILSQNFQTSPLITNPGDNSELDVVGTFYPGSLDEPVYISWVNFYNNEYTLFLKQISPVPGEDKVVTSGINKISNPQIGIEKIAWQVEENNTWKVYLKNIDSGVLSDSVIILDSLEADPRITMSYHRLGWIEDGNLYMKEFYPVLSEKIIFDSLNCLVPDLVVNDLNDFTAVIYLRDSNKVCITTFNRHVPPHFQTETTTDDALKRNPKMGMNLEVSFEMFEDGVWKIAYGLPLSYTDNVSCNYFNPLFFTYPMITENEYTPFFLLFDSDTLTGNREVFIKTIGMWTGGPDTMINISNAAGDDYEPKISMMYINDSMYIALFWKHTDGNKTDIWMAKDVFRPYGGGVNDKDINTNFILYQNYPNPFNPLTEIPFQLNKRDHVRITVYNMLGQQTAMLMNEEKEAGYYKIKFNGSSLPSGIYFYKMETGKFSAMRKMILVK